MKNVFVDTNVLLDVLAKRQSHVRESAQIWAFCETGELHGNISVISFNNIFYVVRKSNGKEDALSALKLLRSVFHSVALDEQGIQQAIDADFTDFEDAIQYQAAIRCGAEFLITRNAHHFPKSGLPVVSPEEFLVLYSTRET